MSEIVIDHAKKIYGDIAVIEDLNLEVPNGALFTLLGPSGCGKTTLLRMIAGFNSIEGGNFYFGKTRINDMDPSKRNIGMVFQDYAIFPHLTVHDNVAFGLKQRKVAKDELERQTEKYLKLMQIDQYKDRKPEQLSGGQRQRIALARALAISPDVLLMDEPLSNLDAKLRLDMRQVIREIQHEVGITTIYVTHDQEEAMAISDKIAVINHGAIQQIGRPKELYHRPANEFVATFIGRTNMIPAKLTHSQGAAVIVFADGSRLTYPELNGTSDQDIRVSIRPEEFIRSDEGDIIATITDSVYLGLNTEYYMDIPFAEKIQVSEESTFDQDLGPGDKVSLKINTRKINIFNSDGSKNLLGVS